MREKGMLGRMFDGIVQAAILYILLTAFFATQTRHIVWGGALALPVTLMGLYALRLWRRRRSGAWTIEQNARHQLHSLMLLPRAQGLCKLSEWLKEFGISDIATDGERLCGNRENVPVEAHLLQRPLDAQVGAQDVLDFYHMVKAPRGILVSTAAFTDAAYVFARQCTGPRIALIGPRELMPVLRKLPAEGGGAVREDAKKRRRATLSELRKRATDAGRQKRYLLYGALMLAAYIVFASWAFLVPGLVCVFLAVIARRGASHEEKLFPDE